MNRLIPSQMYFVEFFSFNLSSRRFEIERLYSRLKTLAHITVSAKNPIQLCTCMAVEYFECDVIENVLPSVSLTAGHSHYILSRGGGGLSRKPLSQLIRFMTRN